MCVNDDIDMAGEKVEKAIPPESSAVGHGLAFPPLESICENNVSPESKDKQVLVIRSGEWSDVGDRRQMEDAHVCIADLAKKFGCQSLDGCSVSFFGVFDGHEGKGAAHFVRDNLPRIIVEDKDFPLELKKVIMRSFMETDAKFAQMCSLHSSLSSGTTALSAVVFERSLLVANAGDCRAVLSQLGIAMEMSKDHTPSCVMEKKRIESLGGSIVGGYLNGQLAVTRALGDWHLEGMKEAGQLGGPLSAEPELKMITLTKEDEFLIIGSDGLWDVFTSQNAVDFARRRLQEHNDVKICSKELVEEAKKRGANDNLTTIVVCFQSGPPAPVPVVRSKVRRCISAEGIHSLKCLLESQ